MEMQVIREIGGCILEYREVGGLGCKKGPACWMLLLRGRVRDMQNAGYTVKAY